VRFFINETRRSLASFRDEVDEDIWLIYNDQVVFSGRHLHTDVSVGGAVRCARGVSEGAVSVPYPQRRTWVCSIQLG
jgi:hypothetical protein